MYKTSKLLRRELRVVYPAGHGAMVLRTELDWDRDIEPVSVSPDGTTSTFTIEARRPFVYFKTCLHPPGGGIRWTVGPNMLLLMTPDESADVYPYFEGSDRGSFSPPIAFDSAILGRQHIVRVYMPAGYHENPMRRFPVVYMQDGKNLFFPEDAFLGRDWGVDQALTLLDTMNVVDRAVIVGVYSGDRIAEYTKPGYEAYARSVVEEIKPQVDRGFRVLDDPRETMVIGSSLGGVVSFYMAWQYPRVFGAAACMSSTFSHKDDLIERVLSEPKSTSRYYLDSGW